MKKLLLLAVAVGLTACGRHTVEPGYVGVKINRTGGEKGISQEVLPPGRYWLSVNEEVYDFPTFTQNYTWSKSANEGRGADESLTIQSTEGMGINMDLGISYEIQASKVPDIFQKYHKGVDELTDVVLRNAVRDALTEVASKMTVEDIIGPKKSELISNAEDKIRRKFDTMGIKVDSLNLIGEMRPPEAVKNALNAKIEATQKAIQAENEVRQAKAEADKAVATARGEAEANNLKTRSLTPELIRYEAIQKWDGKLPHVTGGSVPFINIDK